MGQSDGDRNAKSRAGRGTYDSDKCRLLVSWSNWSGSGRCCWRSGGRGSSGWCSCWFGGFAGFGLFGYRWCHWGCSGWCWRGFGVGCNWRCDNWSGDNWCAFGARSNFGHWSGNFGVFNWSCLGWRCHWWRHWSGVGRWGCNRFGCSGWCNGFSFWRASKSWSSDETHGNNKGFSNIFHCSGYCTCCAGRTLANSLFSRSWRGDVLGQFATRGKLPRCNDGELPALPAR